MFLHLGGDVTISSKKVVAILDAAEISSSEINRNLLEKAQKNGNTVFITDQEHKSIIITFFKDRLRIYYSPISPATLHKRTMVIPESIL